MKKLKWGIIGFGDIVQKRVWPAFKQIENCEIVSISRANKELLKETAENLKIKKWFYDWRELVRDKDIDAVYIATPVYLHSEQVIEAAYNGKHILCEKPMALNADECNKMINACKKNNVKLSIAYYRHFYPVISRIKEIISRDEIGKIILIEANAFEFFNRTPTEPRYWLLEKNKSGGGPMMDFGCHRIEIFLNIAGPVKKVLSINSNSYFNREVEDTSTALFQFENNSHGILKISHAVFESKDSLSIYGSKGSLHAEKLNEGKLKVVVKNNERTENLPPHDNLHLPHIKAFIDAVINKSLILVPGETGLEVNKILDKIYKR